MQTLTRSTRQRTGLTGPTAGRLGGSATRLLERCHAGWLTAVPAVTILGLVLVGAVGWLNLKAVRGLSFEFLYLLVCAGVGWSAGARSALICSLASGALLCLDEAERRNSSSLDWVFFGNSLLCLLAFVVLSWLAAVAGRLTRGLKDSVQQRTARLEREVEEHQETADYLSEARQLFVQVAENIRDVFWATDVEKKVVEYVSPEFEQLWGKACQSLYASPGIWLESVHPDDRERMTHAIFEKQLRGDYDEEYRIVRPDGSQRWVHDRAFPVRDESGAVYRLVGIAEDITERKRGEHLLQAQRDMALALSSTNDLCFALDRLLEIALATESLDCGGMYLLDPESGELHLEAHRGLSAAFLSRASHYSADSTEAQLAKAGRCLYARHDQIPRTLDVLWGSEGLRSLALLPVQHKGAPLGLLALASFRQDELLPRTRVGLELIASQVAGAIARIRSEEALRRSEAHILEISDREQARIGHDLHDGLCQQLIGMAFSANSLHRSLSSEQRPEAATLQKLCTMLDEAITESRRVCRGLYPVRLSTEGLLPALEELAGSTTDRFPVRCCCELQGGLPHCGITAATHLYRIAQEAVNNALKHSGAATISIELCAAEGGLTLQVRDDGKGLDPAAPRRSGMGLHIMEYRARLIGGTLQFQSTAQGTVVSCLVPQLFQRN